MVCGENPQQASPLRPRNTPAPLPTNDTGRAGAATPAAALPREGRTGMAESDLRKLACPSCGHETAFDPRNRPRFMRPAGRPGGAKREWEVVYRVRCADCGKEHDVATGKA
jgi:hypothetical protein